MTAPRGWTPTPRTRAGNAPSRTFITLLTAISVLPVTMYLPALPDMARDLNTSFAVINVSVAGYALATAFAEIVAGALSDRFGRRPVALASLSIFIVASIGCALAPNTEVFLVCRTAQAAIAACFSVAMVVIRETSTEREAVKKAGLAGTGWALAPLCGPAVGGILSGLFGWRSVFAFLALVGAVILLAAMRRLHETAPRATERTPFLMALRGIVGSPRTMFYILCMACSTGTLYIFLGGSPIVMAPEIGGSEFVLGLYLAIVPVGFIAGSYLVSREFARARVGRTLVCARLLPCVVLSAALVVALLQGLPAPLYFALCVVVGLANGVTTPIVSIAVLSEHPDAAGTAAGLSAAASIGGGAVISALAGAALDVTTSSGMLVALILSSASLALVAAVLAVSVDRGVHL